MNNIQKEIGISIATNFITMKSDDMLISEISFINKCLSINEKKKFLNKLFFNKVNEIHDNELIVIKTNLLHIKNMLSSEYFKRHNN